MRLFQRWMETGFKRLELGTAQYSFDATANLILATGTFPAAGYTGWLQIESETDAARTYVLYFEAPDAAVAGTAETFSLEELYEGAIHSRSTSSTARGSITFGDGRGSLCQWPDGLMGASRAAMPHRSGLPT